MNPAKHAVSKSEQLRRAHMIRGTLGMRAAAGYMRKNGWTFEAAHYWLLEHGR